MNDIEEIKRRINIVDLIGGYIDLRKAGRNYKAICPFHTEKTPSFTVAEDKQFWKCFGCGRGGDHFTFLQEYDGLDFREAAEILAEKAGIKLRLSSGDRKVADERKKLKEINAKAAELYHRELLLSDEAKPAREHLAERGLSKKTIVDFKLGYSPRWPRIMEKLLGEGYTPDELADSGLGIKSGGKVPVNDRFRGRLTVPLSDANGETVGFTARVLGSELPKYVNSPETKIYRKARLLYGLDRARAASKETGRIVVVEGNMDVITSHQAGFAETVATSGTALSEEQIELLKRYTSEVIFALDVDSAGEAATKRALALASQQGLTLRVADLRDGKDPAEAMTKNPAGYKKALDKALPFLDYLIEKAVSSYGTAEAPAKKKIAAEVLPYFLYLESIEKAHYVQKLAELLSVPEESIYQALKKSGKPRTEPTARPEAASLTIEERLFEHIAALVLSFPELKDQLAKELDVFSVNLKERVESLAGGAEAFGREAKNRIKEEALSLEGNDSFSPTGDLKLSIRRLNEFGIRKILDQLRGQIAEAEKAGDRKRKEELVNRFQEISRQLVERPPA